MSFELEGMLILSKMPTPLCKSSVDWTKVIDLGVTCTISQVL